MKKVKASATMTVYFVKFHLLDESLSHSHRMCFGVVVGMVGVVISSALSAYPFLSHAGHWFGYLVHGMGCVPFLNYLAPESKPE